MKKNCKTFGSDGKGNGRALNADVVGEALKAYLDGENTEAWNFAYRLCRDSDEAGELLQEACYRVLRESRRYDPSKPVKSWLFTILRNIFLDSRRRTERRAGISLDYEVNGQGAFLQEMLAMDEPSILDGLERKDTAARMRKALKKLRREERKVVSLCDGEGMCYQDAAQVLGIPRGTVASRLNRARQKLRGHAISLGLG